MKYFNQEPTVVISFHCSQFSSLFLVPTVKITNMCLVPKVLITKMTLSQTLRYNWILKRSAPSHESVVQTHLIWTISRSWSEVQSYKDTYSYFRSYKANTVNVAPMLIIFHAIPIMSYAFEPSYQILAPVKPSLNLYMWTIFFNPVLHMSELFLGICQCCT